MSVPAVSMVIPVYNEQANLTELVERCVRVCEGLKQTYEIILADIAQHCYS